MKKNVIVNEYSVRVDYCDEDGNLKYSTIDYDGGDYEWINHMGIISHSFLYLSNNRGVIGYEIDGDVRYPLSDEEFERYI